MPKSEREFVEQLPVSEVSSWIYERQQVNEEKLREQVADIETRGVIEPIIVRRTSKGYEGIAGWLRFKASKETKRATIPAIVYRKIDDAKAVELLAVENIQRQELSDLDMANILSLFVAQSKATEPDIMQKEIARRLNVSEPYLSNYLQLLKDREPLRKAISEGKVTESQARLIRALPTEKAMTEAITEIERIDIEKKKGDENASITVRETKDVVTETMGKYTKEKFEEEIKGYEEKIASIQTFKTQRDGLQQDIDKLSGELKSLKTDNKELNRNIQKISLIEAKYFPARDEITQLQSQINDLNKTRPKTPEDHIKRLEKEKTSLYERQAKLKAEMDTLNEQIKDKRKEHKTLQEQASTITQQIATIKSVEVQIQNAEKQLRKNKETVAEFQTTHKQAIDNFDALKAKVEAEDRTLLEKRKAIADKIANLSHEKLQLNGKIANEKNYQEAIEVLRKKLKTAN